MTNLIINLENGTVRIGTVDGEVNGLGYAIYSMDCTSDVVEHVFCQWLIEDVMAIIDGQDNFSELYNKCQAINDVINGETEKYNCYSDMADIFFVNDAYRVLFAD